MRVTRAALAALTPLLFGACAADAIHEEGIGGQAVLFGVYVGQAGGGGAVTRNNTPWPEGTEGLMTEARLKEYGFGVCAAYTEATTVTAATLPGTPCNFMWNQPVAWNAASSQWEYTPIKYWPNGEGMNSDATATGQTPHYVSFAAYAPYGATVDNQWANGNSGILNISGNNMGMNDTKIEYESNIWQPTHDYLDMLVSDPLLNQTKQAVGGRLQFAFRHATSLLTMKVATVIDATTAAATQDQPAQTKVMIESAEVKLPVPWSGNYYLFRGEWRPVNFSGEDRRTYIEMSAGNDRLATDLRYNDAGAAANFDAGAAPGATTAPVNILANDRQLALIPNSTFAEADRQRGMVVNIRYRVITHDPALVRNGGYASVINNITATIATPTFVFEPGKKYALLMELGLTSINFTVSESAWPWTPGGDIDPTPIEPENIVLGPAVISWENDAPVNVGLDEVEYIVFGPAVTPWEDGGNTNIDVQKP